MNFLLLVVSCLIILSKFFDCYTTACQIRQIHQERNPIAQKIMQKIGIQSTIWLIFIVTILIVATSHILLLYCYSSIILKLFYVLLGLFIATVQFSVAYTNSTKRLNFITKNLMKIYSKKC
jgi:hypothetical protein